MNTEKRLAISFALSILIVFAFQWYHTKKYPPRKPSPAVATAPTAAPTLSNGEPTPEVTPSEQPPAPSAGAAAHSPWAWLAADTSETNPSGSSPVQVENSLYRITFSTFGAAPVSWKLLKFEELFSDPRYLELLLRHGSPAEQQQAQLELDLMRQKDSVQTKWLPVEAIDPTFAPGEAGLKIKWGNSLPDNRIPYTCATPQVTVDKPTDVTFSFSRNGFLIEKIYHFYPDNYRVDLKLNIQNQTGQPVIFSGEDYYDIGWFGGFGIPSFRWDLVNNVLIQQEGSVTIQPTQALQGEIQKQQAILLPGFSSPTLPVTGSPVGWVGVGQKYFLGAIVPGLLTEYAFKGGASAGGLAQSVLKPHTGVRMKMDPLRAGETHSDQFTLYVGPTDEDDLGVAQAGLEDANQIFLKRMVGPIAQLMLRLLQGLYLIVPNYGVAIILLTLIVKVLMLPVYHKQMASMKKMQAIQPQINALREQHKNDPQRLQKEQMELFRRHKVNPMAGCLPMLVTIPIFIALYATFNMAVELRGAPFVGWIHDLSSPDRAFFLPIGGTIITINILPVAYAALMLWSTSQQKMEGPNAATMRILPIMFVFLFWNIASGVILYFVISIFIDTVQRLFMDKLQKGDPLSPPAPLP